MKKQCALIVAVAATCLLFFSCRENRFPRSLVVADSLAETNPDSAVKYIRTLRKKVSNYSKREDFFYELVRVKADDKAYIEHGLKDTVMVDAATYFESTGPDSLAAVAWYYAGSVFRDLKNEPQALDYYQRAQNIMPANMSPKFKSRLYGQMGLLFLRQDLYANARDMMKRALSYDIQNKDTMEMVYSYRDLSNIYDDMGLRDSSHIYIQKAYNLALSSNKINIPAIIYDDLALSFYEKNQFDKALNIANKYIVEGEQDTEFHQRNLSIIQFERGQFDSVRKYCNSLIDNSKISENIAFAYYLLGQTDVIEGKEGEAAYHFKQYRLYNDSVQKDKSAEIIARMNAAFNYQKEQKKVLHLQMERKIIFAFSGLAFICMGFLVYFFYTRSKAIKQHMKIASLQLEQLKTRIKEYDNKSVVEKNIEKDKIFNSPIYKRMNNVAKHAQEAPAIKAEEWIEFETLMNEVFLNFSSKLKALHDVSEMELHVCLLIKAGFKPKDISNMVNRSLSALSSLRRRLYKKVYNLDPKEPADWDKVILSL